MSEARMGANSGRSLVVHPTLHDRFWRKVERGDGCWLWTAALNRTGYGVFSLLSSHGGTHAAHRVAYAIANGSVPHGRVVMHTCDNRRCVNPAHLRLGAQVDNVRDMVAKGRHNSRAERADRERVRRQDDAVAYMDYLHANLCGFAKALNLGPMPLAFEAWRRARYGMEQAG